MSFWNISWKSLKKNMIMNAFAIIQMCAVFVLTAIMMSSLSIRYATYKPFEKILSGNGIFVHYSGFASTTSTSSQIEDVFDKKTFYEQFPHAKHIISCYAPIIYIGNEQDGYYEHQIISMDDELIQIYQPELEAGRWMKCNPDGEYVEAVVSDNIYGWTIGELIEIHSALDPENQPVKLKITGVLKEGAKVPIGNHIVSEDIDYNSFYYPYSFEIEQLPLILTSSSALEKIAGASVKQGVTALSIIIYDESAEEKMINDDIKKLDRFGTCYYSQLHLCELYSKIYLKKQLYNLLPIVIVLFVMTIVSTISSSALSARRRLHDYAIFHVVGLQWKYCSIINFFQSIIIVIISISITAAILILFVLRFQNEITIIWNQYLWGAEFLLVVFYLIISMVMPLFTIMHHTPKQILSR